MIHTFRSVTAALLAAALPLPAFAQTHVIAELGSAPLIGQIDSTQRLQTDVARNRALFAAAADKLGLSAAEYAQFEARVNERELAYVTIPQNLDAMTWSSGGRVYVLHDVRIPAETKGWEIDLHENHELVALFIPNKCGNLSVVRKRLPLIAKAPAPKRVAVEAESTVPQPAPAAPAAPTAAPAPITLPQTAATPPPFETLATSSAPPASTHHVRLWPLLLIPVVALLAFHGGSSSSVPPSTPLSPPPHVPPGNGSPPPVSPTPPPSGPPPPSCTGAAAAIGLAFRI